MERKNLLQNIREHLTQAGYYVSDLYQTRMMGFDLIARKDNSLLILKVLTNIDALSDAVSYELKKLAHLLNAVPLMIGEKSGTGPLEDDVVYFRFGIQVITFNTFNNHFLKGIRVKAYAAPGGLYVNLDSDRLRELRREQDISLGEFARFVRVTRRTASLYEDGMNARVEIAMRIEDLLGGNIAVPIDLLKPSNDDKKQSISFHGKETEIKDFQREIFSILQKVGYSIVPMENCPFEALSMEKDKVLLTCVQKYNKKLIKKAKIVSSISKITERYAVVFTDRDVGKTNVEGTPIIKKKELKKIRDPEEILELIIERI